MQKIKELCLLFYSLTEKETKMVESKLVLRSFRAKEHIIREGNDNSNLYIIQNGVVRVDTYNNNKRQTLSFLKEGDFFGEIAVFTNTQTSANVVSVVNSDIFIIKKKDLENLMAKAPQISTNIITYLATRVKKADHVIFDYAFKMLEARVASKLITLMHMFKGKNKDKTFINLPITHQDLADYVGTSRETVTKILSKMKEDNIIEIQTKRISILDVDKLESWIGD